MKKTIKTLLFTFLGWNAMAQNISPETESLNQETKKEWIKNNPDKYVQMGGQIELKDTEKTDVTIQNSEGELKIEIPPFPILENSGNSKVDAENFERKKNEWYAKIAAIHEYNRTYMQTSIEKEKWVQNNSSIYNMK